VNKTTIWIKEHAAVDSRPFFVYQGMVIVHPPYKTSKYWYDKVNQSKIRIPKWRDLDDMHPCDFQASMLKGCLPPDDTAGDFYTESNRFHIRTVYLAMIAEFDAMVGAYVQAVKDAGKSDNIVFIVTSDHGDMQMEHRQFYKMAAYDASSRVPMVIMDGRQPRQAPLVMNVAKYNHESMKWWTKNTTDWQNEINQTSLRWSKSWNQDAEGAVAAVTAWLAKPPTVEACRSEHAWPAPPHLSLA